MSATANSGRCLEVQERLSEVLDGEAPGSLYDHIADCDECRDLRHDAERAAARVALAGEDFQAAAGFEGRVRARVLEAQPAARGGGQAAAVVASSAKVAPPEGREPENAASDFATSPTVLAPLTPRADEAAKGSGEVAQGTTGEVQRASGVRPLSSAGASSEGVAAAVSVSEAAGVSAASAASSEDARIPAAKTDAPSEPAAELAAGQTANERAPGREKPAPTKPDEGSTSPALAAPPPAATPKPAAKKPASSLRRALFAGSAAVAVGAVAAVGIYVSGRSQEGSVVVDAPWTGKVSAVSRASAEKTGGLVGCNLANVCAPIEAGAAIPVGTSLRTDTRTRAHVELADGTKLAIDRGSSIELAAKEKRSLRITKGSVVADVASAKEGPAARFLLPQGEVEVLGTLLSITASDERASVEVARGSVRVTGRSGAAVEVRAGEEATLGQKGEPSVASATSLAEVLEWSDRSPEEVDAPVLRGLGELRARKPGQTKEREAAVRLAKHAVKVRIVDMVARTEVDETFANDTDEELEGIFRFPLPPGAQIEKLALEVDGKLLDGAFVDRDRGAAIWRGVIQNAAPKAPKPREEIVWVPGPWRDPALLEWQRGGRFELRIFPIPKKGSRRVVLTYTELVTQAGGVRRFTYPLAHDSSGTTKIDSFDLDVQVLGLDKELGIQARGYELASAPSPDPSAERRTLSANGFTPAGDLTVEYALPDRTKEVSAWAYRAPPEPPRGIDEGPSGTAAIAPAKAKTPEDKAAADTAAAILNDASPYVAIALRPKLPRWKEAKERVFAIVVDASRSMVGERFARASRLASAIVREMDRRDSFVLLACDTVCRAMPEAGSDSERDGRGKSAAVAAPMPPGQAAAGNVERFLGGFEPDGGSDPSAAVSAARAAAGSLRGRELRVLYLGDGTPTVGPIRAGHLETAVRSSLPNGEGSVIAVALGADADATSLAALARGGGGVVVPYVPGQKVVSAALDVLSTAYGVVLRDLEIELPPGLSQVTPARLDPIRAGGETLIVARMSGGSEVSGSIRLRGRILDERFEQTYPVRITATSSGGNAFVPRLFAGAKIAELEQAGGDAHKSTIIELSKRFSVASRFTSLLVLESEAMFKAFGLDRLSGGPAFTGEEQAQRSEADAEGEEALDEDAKDSEAEPRPAATAAPAKEERAPLGLGGGGFATPPAPKTSKPKPVSIPGDPLEDAPGSPFNPAPPSPPPPSQPSPSPKGKSACAPNDLLCHMQSGPSMPPPPPPPPRRLVAMRKVFDRKGAFEAQNTFVAQNASKLLAAESALTAAPDSRDKTADLYALYATSGRLGEAQELTAKWSNKDALDPDALLARSDLAARQGDRDRSTRILGGLADVRPGDKAIHTRLAKLHDAAGNPALACRHRLTLADLAPGDAALVADAVRCARAQQMGDLASQIKLDAGDKVREAVDKLLIAPAADASALRGDVQITAEWTGAADLDIALIDEKGKRTSWLGSASKSGVSARDVTSSRSETLSIADLGRGSYVIELSLAAGEEAARNAGNIRGDVTVRLPGGETRKVPFTLSGSRVEVGTLRIFFTSRLVPL
jgi:hypothetical protein